MEKPACIMCGKEKNGLGVRDDFVINSIRWVKRNVTKNSREYKLVVCKECFLNYKKKRESYERKMMIYGALGVIFLAALVVATGGRLGAIGIGLVIVFFLMLLAQFSYVPAVKMPGDSERKPKTAQRRRKRQTTRRGKI